MYRLVRGCTELVLNKPVEQACFACAAAVSACTGLSAGQGLRLVRSRIRLSRLVRRLVQVFFRWIFFRCNIVMVLCWQQFVLKKQPVLLHSVSGLHPLCEMYISCDDSSFNKLVSGFIQLVFPLNKFLPSQYSPGLR